MRTLAILPMKRFDAAKKRLSELLGAGSRQALAQAMFLDVLASLRRVPSLDGIAVVTRDPQAESAALGLRTQVIRDAEEAGQSAATGLGIRHALAAGYERVVVVPGDTPLLDPVEFDELLRRAEEAGLEAVIVPDRHERGTNGLVISPPDALEPSFGLESLARHVAAARATELSYRVEPTPCLAHDVDTPEDLYELAAVLAHRRGFASMTRGALSQLDRSAVRRSVGAKIDLRVA